MEGPISPRSIAQIKTRGGSYRGRKLVMERNHKEYRAMERKGRPTSQTVTRDWSVGLDDVGSEPLIIID